MRFTPSTRLTAQTKNAAAFTAVLAPEQNAFVVRELPGGKNTLPDAKTFSPEENALWSGDLAGEHVLVREISGDTPLPDGFHWRNLREATLLLGEAECNAVCRAMELTHWRKKTRYCGHCSAALQDAPDECARLCPACRALYFPVIAPAVIVLVTWGKEILLAHNNRFKAGLFGLIAGFVESGETPEQAVVREVAEEVGIQVGNIRYWGSQCWPFPNSLMLGFRAEYESGEVAPDGAEIGEVGFFAPGNWPNTPIPGSIASRMIEAYRKELSESGEWI